MMIGKIKAFNFNHLLFLVSFCLFITSYIFSNYLLILTFVIFFFISLLTTKYGLKIIKQLNLLQNIRIEGPSNHISKKNTPTLGGIFIIVPFLILILLISIKLTSIKLFLLFLTISCYFLVGFTDDYLSIKNKKNTGLKSNQKFLLQTFFALFFIFIALKKNYISHEILINNNWMIDSNVLIITFCFFTLVGLSNAVNLTDGLDGLASGCSSIVFYGLGTEILLQGDQELIIFSVICYSMAGLCLGFLKFNKYPAKIFMGDTGSLSIGASLGCISILTNSFFTLFIFSGIFIIEALSVIIQVSFFKITKRFLNNGKRLFLMTPIHHHFELKGIKEENIVENFWKINILLVFLGIVLKTNL